MSSVKAAKTMYQLAGEVVRLRWLLFDLQVEYMTNEDLTARGRRRLKNLIARLESRLEFLESRGAASLRNWDFLVGLAAVHLSEKDVKEVLPGEFRVVMYAGRILDYSRQLNAEPVA